MKTNALGVLRSGIGITPWPINMNFDSEDYYYNLMKVTFANDGLEKTKFF